MRLKNLKEQLLIIKNGIVALREIHRISPIYLFLVVLSALLSSVYNIFNVIIIKIIIDIIQSNNGDKFTMIALIILFIGFFIHFFNAYLSNVKVPMILNKIGNSLYEGIYKKYLCFTYDETSNNDFYNNYFFILENSESAFIETFKLFGNLLTNAITIIGLSYIILNYELYILAIILISVIVSFAMSMAKEKLQHSFMISTTPDRRELSYVSRLFYLQEYAKELRFNDSSIFFSSMRHAYFSLRNHIKKWGVKLQNTAFISNSSITIASVIILMIFGHKTIKGEIDIGAFSMLYMGSQKLSGSLIQFISVFPKLYFYALNIDKYRKFMNYHTDTRKMLEVDEIKKIQIKDLDYDYDGHQIFSNLNLTLSSGNIFFIVGKNGTGKSTLIHLIAGILQPKKGKVLINDIELDRYDRNSFLKRMSIVSQDFKIFFYNIAQNIIMKYDLEDDDYQKAKKAIEMVGLQEKVKSFSEGIYSPVSNEFNQKGIGFSLGEQQRLAFSRAFVKDADIIILDEPSSFSDSYYKKEIISLVKTNFKNKLVIIVSHDYSCIDESDQIIYINENGNIKTGELNELLKSEKDFYGIYKNK